MARDHVTWAGEEDASKPRTEEWVEVSEWGGSKDQCAQNGKEHEPNPEVRRECGIFRDVCVWMGARHRRPYLLMNEHVSECVDE